MCCQLYRRMSVWTEPVSTTWHVVCVLRFAICSINNLYHDIFLSEFSLLAAAYRDPFHSFVEWTKFKLFVGDTQNRIVFYISLKELHVNGEVNQL